MLAMMLLSDQIECDFEKTFPGLCGPSGKPLHIDIWVPRIYTAIEVDGAQHKNQRIFYALCNGSDESKERQWNESQERDRAKDRHFMADPTAKLMRVALYDEEFRSLPPGEEFKRIVDVRNAIFQMVYPDRELKPVSETELSRICINADAKRGLPRRIFDKSNGFFSYVSSDPEKMEHALVRCARGHLTSRRKVFFSTMQHPTWGSKSPHYGCLGCRNANFIDEAELKLLAKSPAAKVQRQVYEREFLGFADVPVHKRLVKDSQLDFEYCHPRLSTPASLRVSIAALLDEKYTDPGRLFDEIENELRRRCDMLGIVATREMFQFLAVMAEGDRFGLDFQLTSICDPNFSASVNVHSVDRVLSILSSRYEWLRLWSTPEPSSWSGRYLPSFDSLESGLREFASLPYEIRSLLSDQELSEDLVDCDQDEKNRSEIIAYNKLIRGGGGRPLPPALRSRRYRSISELVEAYRFWRARVEPKLSALTTQYAALSGFEDFFGKASFVKLQHLACFRISFATVEGIVGGRRRAPLCQHASCWQPHLSRLRKGREAPNRTDVDALDAEIRSLSCGTLTLVRTTFKDKRSPFNVQVLCGEKAGEQLKVSTHSNWQKRSLYVVRGREFRDALDLCRSDATMPSASHCAIDQSLVFWSSASVIEILRRLSDEMKLSWTQLREAQPQIFTTLARRDDFCRIRDSMVEVGRRTNAKTTKARHAERRSSYCSFEEVRAFAKQHQLSSQPQWYAFAKRNREQLKSSGVPSNVCAVYKARGEWQGWAHFFGR